MRSLSTRRYGLLVVLTFLASLAGYAGYVLYPRLDLPAVAGPSLMLLAAAAGVASFFSPCSFPLALTLLARELDARGSHRSPVRSGLWIGAGALTFLAAAGALLAVGAAGLFGQVTFDSTAGITIRAVTGGVLILLGLVQLGFVRLRLHRVEGAARPVQALQQRLQQDHPGLAFGLFGFSYLLAGFG